MDAVAPQEGAPPLEPERDREERIRRTLPLSACTCPPTGDVRKIGTVAEIVDASRKENAIGGGIVIDLGSATTEIVAIVTATPETRNATATTTVTTAIETGTESWVKSCLSGHPLLAWLQRYGAPLALVVTKVLGDNAVCTDEPILVRSRLGVGAIETMMIEIGTTRLRVSAAAASASRASTLVHHPEASPHPEGLCHWLLLASVRRVLACTQGQVSGLAVCAPPIDI
eukprot:scaffold293_cov267-Prasinococcus_capsulatus_cf.AAC.15